MVELSNIPFVGEIASLAAAMTWGVTINIHTHFSKKFPAHSLNLFRISIGVVCLTLASAVFHFPWPEDSRAAFWLFASGGLGIALGDLFLFLAMRRIGASLSSVIQITAPLFATLFGFVFLGETLTKHELLGIALVTTSLGCIFALKWKESSQHEVTGDSQVLLSGVMFAFLTSLLTASSYVVVHHWLSAVHPVTGTALRMWGGLVTMLFLSMPWFGGPGFSPLNDIFQNKQARASLAFAAFLSTCLGFVFATIGLKYALVGVSSALQKTHPLFVMPIARYYRGEQVSNAAFLLTCVAIGGIVLMFL